MDNAVSTHAKKTHLPLGHVNLLSKLLTLVQLGLRTLQCQCVVQVRYESMNDALTAKRSSSASFRRVCLTTLCSRTFYTASNVRRGLPGADAIHQYAYLQFLDRCTAHG